jgi:hypothetical protein
MKTIQGMVAQYFIMKLDDPHIEFISSLNKLKNYIPTMDVSFHTISDISQGSATMSPLQSSATMSPLENTFYPTEVPDSDDEDNIPAFDKKIYKQHKSDGVKYCLDIMGKTDNASWADKMIVHKKKDDLADAFLQGYWYLSKSK